MKTSRPSPATGARAVLIAVTAVALLVLPLPSAAQSRASHRVSRSADLALGGAKGRGGEYTDREQAIFRLGAHGTLRLTTVLDALVGVEGELASYPGDRLDSCVIDSLGGCQPNFPGIRGWATTAGLRYHPLRWAALSVVGGPGWYTASIERSGRNADVGSRAWVVQGDVAVRTWQRLWLTAARREVRMRSVDGDRLTLSPILVGLRIDWGR